MKKLIRINGSALLTQIIHFFVYYLMIWIFHLLLISTVAFFHFLLEHSLSTIEEWVHDHGWDLVIITKLCVLAITVSLIKTEPLLKMFRKRVISLREICLTIVFLYIPLIFFTKPYLREEFDYVLILKSFVGIFIFYMTDVIFWVLLQERFKIYTVANRTLSIFILSCILFFSTRISFFKEDLTWMSLLFVGFSLYLATWRKLNYTLPLIFILGFICPVSSFFGADPIWGSSYALFELKNPVGAVNMLILLIVAYQYMVIKEIGFRRFIEYLSLLLFRRRIRWKQKD